MNPLLIAVVLGTLAGTLAGYVVHCLTVAGG